MPRRSTGPWWREGRGWFAFHRGRQVNLRYNVRADTSGAVERWHRLKAGMPLDGSSRPAAGGISLGDLLDGYLEHLSKRRSDAHYRGTLDRLGAVDAVLGDMAAAGLVQADIDRLLEFYGEPRMKGNRTLPAWGPTRIANVLTALRGALRWASRKGGLLEANPLPQIDLPTRRRRVDSPTADQIKELLAESGPELRTMLRALSVCGARPGELMRAERSHCDPDGSAIRLPTGKQGRRLILFPKGFRPTLKRLRKAADPWLFLSAGGSRWTTDTLGHATADAKNRAKLPSWLTCYTLRHAWITERLRAGVPIATVARMAGTSVTMIDTVYGHFSDQDLRDVADAM